MATPTPPQRPPNADEPKTATTDATSAATAPTGAAVPPGGRIIKRYSNRKLYDTVESRYVTLEQIAKLVGKGEDVRIIDNNSKEDLTSVTLAQALYDLERKQSRTPPLSGLKELISASSERIMSTLRERAVGKFISKAAEAPTSGGGEPAASAGATLSVSSGKVGAGGSHVGESVGHTSSAADEPAAAVAGPKDTAVASKPPGRLYEMFEQSRGSIQEWQHRVDERVRKVLEGLSPASHVEKLQAEVRRLTQRLEDLEAKVGMAGKREEDPALRGQGEPNSGPVGGTERGR